MRLGARCLQRPVYHHMLHAVCSMQVQYSYIICKYSYLYSIVDSSWKISGGRPERLCESSSSDGRPVSTLVPFAAVVQVIGMVMTMTTGKTVTTVEPQDRDNLRTVTPQSVDASRAERRAGNTSENTVQYEYSCSHVSSIDSCQAGKMSLRVLEAEATRRCRAAWAATAQCHTPHPETAHIAPLRRRVVPGVAPRPDEPKRDHE